MTFNSLIQTIQAKLLQPLPGEAAQFSMAPGNRQRKPAEPSQVSTGGVMILLYPGLDAHYLLLTKRPDYQGVHGGQVCFPGGRSEPQDSNLTETALRETAEETGVPADGANLLGALKPLYIPPSNFRVYPFVGYLTKTPDFRPDPKEVEALIPIPVHALWDASIQKLGMIELANGQRIKSPYFALAGYTVWGATAMMLNEFIALSTDLTVTQHA